MELDKDTTERLLDAMLFCFGPFISNDDFRDENPWLFELAESYNEIVRSFHGIGGCTSTNYFYLKKKGFALSCRCFLKDGAKCFQK